MFTTKIRSMFTPRCFFVFLIRNSKNYQHISGLTFSIISEKNNSSSKSNHLHISQNSNLYFIVLMNNQTFFYQIWNFNSNPRAKLKKKKKLLIRRKCTDDTSGNKEAIIEDLLHSFLVNKVTQQDQVAWSSYATDTKMIDFLHFPKFLKWK